MGGEGFRYRADIVKKAVFFSDIAKDVAFTVVINTDGKSVIIRQSAIAFYLFICF